MKAFQHFSTASTNYYGCFPLYLPDQDSASSLSFESVHDTCGEMSSRICPRIATWAWGAAMFFILSLQAI